MANYKETPLTGVKWQRCCGVQIENPYNGVPIIHMDEESIAVVVDTQYKNRMLGMVMQFDPTEVTPLIDLTTGLPTGQTVTGLDIYQGIYSFYLKHAKLRDGVV